MFFVIFHLNKDDDLIKQRKSFFKEFKQFIKI